MNSLREMDELKISLTVQKVTSLKLIMY